MNKFKMVKYVKWSEAQKTSCTAGPGCRVFPLRRFPIFVPVRIGLAEVPDWQVVNGNVASPSAPWVHREVFDSRLTTGLPTFSKLLPRIRRNLDDLQLVQSVKHVLVTCLLLVRRMFCLRWSP